MAIIYLYPNSNLTPNELKSYGANGYLAIDDPYNSPDNDTTYVYGDYTLDGDWKYSHYGFGNIPYDYGIISKVTVYCRSRKYNTNTTYLGFVGGACFYLRNNGNYSLVGNGQDSYSWNTINKEYTKNPWTNLNWTFSEVNSLLIRIGSAGIKVYEPAIEDYIYATHRITQVYLKVEGTFVDLPTVTTATTPIAKDHESATLGGEVTDNGEGIITKRGFQYKEGEEGEVLSVFEEDDDFGEGEFELEITGLKPYTEYYYRAYAVNEAGTGYGDWESFTTDKTTPTVTIQSASNISTTSVTVNGVIISTGGEDCSERGFEYGLTKVATWTVKDTVGGYGIGTFSKDLTDLTPNTIYWIRAYAKNSVGTGYGEWISFQTAVTGATPTNTRITLTGDVSGYISQMHSNYDTDLDYPYDSYFVIATDLSQDNSLKFYKRLLTLDNYLRKESAGTITISIKCDHETDWRELGDIDLTGTADIVVPYLAVDELGKHFLIKFSGKNVFRYLGTIFEFVIQGER